MKVAGGHKTACEGKDKGGMAIGIRKELVERGTEIVVKEEGIMMGYVRQGRER